MREDTKLFNLEAEKAIIGGLIACEPDRAGDLYDKVSKIVSENDFCDPSHRVVYQVIKELAESGNSFDLITVSDALEAKKRLNDMDKLLRVLVASGLTYYGTIGQAKVIRRLAKSRAIARAGEECIALAESGKDPDEILEVAQRLLSSAIKSSAKMQHISTVINDVKELIAAETSGIKLHGVSSGFSRLDGYIQTFAPGNLYLLGARPGMGKTALALNFAINAAKQDKTVLFFSLEMPNIQLGKRLVSTCSGFSTSSLNERTSAKELDQFVRSYDFLSKLSIYMQDSAGLSIEELCAITRQAYRQKKLDMLVVDYTQLVYSSGKESETLLVGKISKSLKNIAKELNIPVIALSQLNRSLESRQDKRPMLSDLRQSGELEQDADVVMFIYRDEVYDENSSFSGIAELIIAKNRHGSRGTVPLEYRPEINLFSESDLDIQRMKRDQKNKRDDEI